VSALDEPPFSCRPHSLKEERSNRRQRTLNRPLVRNDSSFNLLLKEGAAHEGKSACERCVATRWYGCSAPRRILQLSRDKIQMRRTAGCFSRGKDPVSVELISSEDSCYRDAGDWRLWRTGKTFSSFSGSHKMACARCGAEAHNWLSPTPFRTAVCDRSGNPDPSASLPF
jgi:hypothetical protein